MTRCAWCPPVEGEEEPRVEEEVSHGMCQECEEQALADLEEEPQEVNHGVDRN